MKYITPLLLVLLFYATQASSQAAYGQLGDYRQVWPAIDFETEYEIWVTVVDERPYVLSREKPNTFTGLSRSNWGIPYDIATVSGKSLAEDVQSAIVKGFMNAGVYAQEDQSPNTLSSPEGETMERHLRVTLYEWKSDTYKNTSFHYHILAEVFGGPGGFTGEARLSGKNEDRSGVDAARKTLTKLFNEQSIKNALDSSFVPSVLSEAAPAPISNSSTPAPEQSGAYDDLINLKDLHDKGIITQEEFDAKKSEILERY